MTAQHYEFVEGDEKVVAPGIVVRRIRALVAIPALLWAPAVQPGELGGYVAASKNLVSGDAWVYGNALVYGDAQVYGNARVTEECSRTPILISGLRYAITITDDHLRAGCQCHLISRWSTFTTAEIAAMDGKDALRFHPQLLALLAAARPNTDEVAA